MRVKYVNEKNVRNAQRLMEKKNERERKKSYHRSDKNGTICNTEKVEMITDGAKGCLIGANV